jgi:excisionase family DNA binding protein
MPRITPRRHATGTGSAEAVLSQYRKTLPVEPLCLRIPAACAFVGISRSKLYELIAAGEIETIKLGTATLVLTESLRGLVDARRTR